jgi:hypothetical protein
MAVPITFIKGHDAMFESECNINRFLLGYAGSMLAEIADERLAEQPLPGVNHPAWILGHLAYSGDGAVGVLGGEKTMSKEWILRFAGGSKLSAVRTDYPTKRELSRVLEERFDTARQLAAAANPERIALPNPNPRLKDGLPTVRDAVAFLLTGHLALHLGQLSAWRRMIGLAPKF